MFHKFMHSINLCVLNKIKIHCRNVQSIFGFFNPDILVKATCPDVPFILFHFISSQRLSKLKEMHAVSSFSKRLHSAPDTPSSEAPWVTAALLPSPPEHPLDVNHCPSLPVAEPDAHPEEPASARGLWIYTVLHIWGDTSQGNTQEHVGYGEPHWLNDPWLSFLCIFQMFVKEMYEAFYFLVLFQEQTKKCVVPQAVFIILHRVHAIKSVN